MHTSLMEFMLEECSFIVQFFCMRHKFIAHNSTAHTKTLKTENSLEYKISLQTPQVGNLKRPIQGGFV